MEVSGQLHSSAADIQGKSIRCQMNRRLGRVHNRSGRFGRREKEISCIYPESNHESSVVRTVASHYTD